MIGWGGGSAGWFAIVVCSVKLSGSSVAVEIGRFMMLGSSSYCTFVALVLVIDCALVVAGVDYVFCVGPGPFTVGDICFLSL